MDPRLLQRIREAFGESVVFDECDRAVELPAAMHLKWPLARNDPQRALEELDALFLTSPSFAEMHPFAFRAYIVECGCPECLYDVPEPLPEISQLNSANWSTATDVIDDLRDVPPSPTTPTSGHPRPSASQRSE